MFFTVEQQTAAIIHRFGRFVRIAGSGLNLRIPFIEQVAGRVNLRVRQLDVEVETKTEDNVFVKVIVSVQYFVLPDKIYDAFYKLDDPERQVRSFVFDVVRARVPKIKLDDVFEKKDEIAIVVKDELAQVMDDFGYGIVKALVTDIDPDPKVKAAMNDINAAQRLRVAATEKGEADKILQVKAAEAEAESKALSGKGIADQRRAIVEGLKESVDEFQKSVEDASAAEVMNLVLMTQYFDTLKEIGNSSSTNTILLPHSPGHLSDLSGQIRDAMIAGEQATAGIRRVSQARSESSESESSQSESDEPFDRKLFEDLRILRSQMAKEKSIPAYMIFHDKHLKDIARSYPLTREALIDIPGIRDRKADEYGDRVIEIVKRHIEQKG